MKRATLGILSIALCLGAAATASATDSSDHVLRKNRNAVVRILVKGVFRGCGFIATPDGLVVTANHIVGVPNARFVTVSGDIDVQRWVKGAYQTYPATVVDTSAASDTALLRTIGFELPHVSFAKKPAAAASSPSATVVFDAGSNAEALASGPIVATAAALRGQLKANIIIARIAPSQFAAWEDASGCPVFDDRGHVIGLLDPHLDRSAAVSSGTSADRAANGLVSAVNISYAKRMIAKENARRFSGSLGESLGIYPDNVVPLQPLTTPVTGDFPH
jgi:S1-C subfamily serine protease